MTHSARKTGRGSTCGPVNGRRPGDQASQRRVGLDLAGSPRTGIEFLIEPDGGGSIVTWTHMGPEGVLDEADIRQRRYRLDQLINGQLRDTFGQ